MVAWGRSSVSKSQMLDLVKKGALPALTDASEWIIPDGHDSPQPGDGYIVSFTWFHERGLGWPVHWFLRGLLDYHQLELHHLNPNGIQSVAAFVGLCEGYLGIEPHFDLWRHLFVVDFLRDHPMGCAGIKLRPGRRAEYLQGQLTVSNKGWHTSWFYLKNDDGGPAPLPRYTGATPSRSHTWGYGGVTGDARIGGALEAIRRLRAAGVQLSDIICSYSARGVAPLREPPLMLFQMAGDAASPDDDDVMKRIGAVIAVDAGFGFPRLGVPAMLPDPNTQALVGDVQMPTSRPPLLAIDDERRANRGDPCSSAEESPRTEGVVVEQAAGPQPESRETPLIEGTPGTSDQAQAQGAAAQAVMEVAAGSFSLLRSVLGGSPPNKRLRTACLAAPQNKPALATSAPVPAVVAQLADAAAEADAPVLPQTVLPDADTAEAEVLPPAPLGRPAEVSRSLSLDDERKLASYRIIQGSMETGLNALRTMETAIHDIERKLNEAANYSKKKSLFLRREAGVWAAADEAQRCNAALRRELAATRVSALKRVESAEDSIAEAERKVRVAVAERKEALGALKVEQEKGAAQAQKLATLAAELKTAEEKSAARAQKLAALEAALRAAEEKTAALDATLNAALETETAQAQQLATLNAALKAEEEKSAAQAQKLAGEASELRKALKEATQVAEKERSECEQLVSALETVLVELKVKADPSRPVSRAMLVPQLTNHLLRSGLRFGVHKAVSIFKSHYPGLEYEKECKGWAEGYEEADYDDIEDMMAAVARALSTVIEDEAEDEGGEGDRMRE